MGTRSLTCVVKNGEFKVAQYCQFDGYPEGQGQIVVDFINCYLKDDTDLDTFNKRVSEVKRISDCELKDLWVECGADPNSNLVSLKVSDIFSEKYPQYDRGFGANILHYIFETPKANVFLDLEFAGDSLFCEWVYVLDLDNNVLEVYRGFVKKPHEGERFSNFEIKDSVIGTDTFYPVKLYESFPFSEVNDNTISMLGLKE